MVTVHQRGACQISVRRRPHPVRVTVQAVQADAQPCLHCMSDACKNTSGNQDSVHKGHQGSEGGSDFCRGAAAHQPQMPGDTAARSAVNGLFPGLSWKQYARCECNPKPCASKRNCTARQLMDSKS